MVDNETFDNSANTVKKNLTEQANNFLETTETWTTDGMDELNYQNDMGM